MLVQLFLLNQAIIQSINTVTGLSIGTFTISNVNGGISIIAQSVPDNNNVTSGNSQSVTFNNIFINPASGILTFTSTINSELGDVDLQSFPFTIVCLCLPTSSVSLVTECDTYTWNGTTYSASGAYTYVTTNSNGCDSTATLNLTINPSSTFSVSVTECDTIILGMDRLILHQGLILLQQQTLMDVIQQQRLT